MLGTVIGAFGGYLALASVGSGGTDLTDLTTLVFWSLVLVASVALSLDIRNQHTFALFPPLAVWLAPLAQLSYAVVDSSGRQAPHEIARGGVLFNRGPKGRW